MGSKESGRASHGWWLQQCSSSARLKPQAPPPWLHPKPLPTPSPPPSAGLHCSSISWPVPPLAALPFPSQRRLSLPLHLSPSTLSLSPTPARPSLEKGEVGGVEDEPGPPGQAPAATPPAPRFLLSTATATAVPAPEDLAAAGGGGDGWWWRRRFMASAATFGGVGGGRLGGGGGGVL
jgi:hypothetical protein